MKAIGRVAVGIAVTCAVLQCAQGPKLREDVMGKATDRATSREGAATVKELETTGIMPGSVANVAAICRESLEMSKDMVSRLVALKTADRTFENSVAKLDEIVDTLSSAGSAANLLMEVHPDAKIREESQRCLLDIEKYSNELMLRRDFYEAVTEKKFPNLKGEDLRFYKDTLLAFKRSGVHLPTAQRQQLQKLRDEMSVLETDFNKNIAADKTTIKATAAELKGLPERNLAALKREGESYILGMDYPTVTAVMQNVEVEETRKRLQMAFNNRAYPQNVPILEKVVKLRHEMAQILGYESYAAYQLDDLMAKSPKAVRAFLDDLRVRARAKAETDFADLQAMKAKVTGDKKAQVYTWDKGYLINLIKEQKYKIDEEKVSEYFPVQATVDGLFTISQKLYGIQFKEVKASWTWHPDVKLYEVWSVADNKLIGRFYTDLHPRPDKYSHAAKFGIVSGREVAEKKYRIPTVVIVANFPKATGSTPALLKHDDVETFFHEFGHCLHSMLTEAKYSSHSGTSVARDFVEAPSQMFENWVWDEKGLSLFAKHFKTGEPLPKSLLKSMLEAKNLNSGIDTQQQIYYSEISLALYSSGPDVNTDSLLKELHKKNTLFPYFEGTHFQAAFGHLTGYGAGYYGYQWSKVYAQDMFTRFEGKNILSSTVGMQYRKKVLAKGSGREEMKSVVDFLGRKPNSKAFFKSLGFSTKETVSRR